jgi:phosphoribosylglycinamide formyltransferase 2
MNKKIMLLGSGELGKEFAIAAKRLGLTVIAVDRYAGAPAQQVADFSAVVDMLSGVELKNVVKKFKPDIIIPEIEAIQTTTLKEFEKLGIQVVPTAEAAHLTMNRDAIREVAAKTLKLRTAKYAYATTTQELLDVAVKIGFPVVVKPVMSSSGKGQSIATNIKEAAASFKYAMEQGRGSGKNPRVIVEEFIKFDLEITLLTVKQKNKPTLFVEPIGHRQERGDYQESWMPALLSPVAYKSACQMAKKVTDYLGGSGIFGVEFFVCGDEVIFSELSPRPHDTGMVTLISQDLNEFELHLRAVLGLPIPVIRYKGASASSVILSDKDSKKFSFLGLDKALAQKDTDIRIFGKPETRKHRRMGVALALGKSVAEARKKANKAAKCISIKYE